jgi:hypothetical protein
MVCGRIARSTMLESSSMQAVAQEALESDAP